MATHTLRRPHEHPASPASPLWLEIKQDGVVTAYGVAWEGALPKLTGRLDEPVDSTTTERVVWALNRATFKYQKPRSIVPLTSSGSVGQWRASYDNNNFDLLVGWRRKTIKLAGTEYELGVDLPRSTSGAAPPCPCVADNTRPVLWRFVKTRMNSGGVQSDYGISPIYDASLTELMGAVVMTDSLLANGESGYEIWRLKTGVGEATPAMFMGTAIGWLKDSLLGDLDGHVQRITAEAMVHADIKDWGLAIYEFAFHEPK